jgi:hypothetical protein
MTAIRETERPRPGRRFEPTHERALYDDACLACETLPGAHRGVMAVREMVGPIGIPDLTALVGGEKLLDARLALGVQPLLNQLDAAIVASTYANVGRTAAAIADALGWPLPTVERRLPNLVRSGALHAGSNSCYRRPEALQPVGRLYAVEMKVRDVGAAVQQARMYSVWADAYVVVMGRLGERPFSRMIEEVSADQAGLMIDGRWIRRPSLGSLDICRRLWASEHFVAALRGHNQPSVVA